MWFALMFVFNIYSCSSLSLFCACNFRSLSSMLFGGSFPCVASKITRDKIYPKVQIQIELCSWIFSLSWMEPKSQI